MIRRGARFVRGVLIGAGVAYSLGRRWDALIGRQGHGSSRYGSRRGDIAGLASATLARRRATRRGRGMALRLVGKALLWYGLTRRGRLGSIVRGLGVGLFMRGRARRSLSDEGHRERRHIVDIQKTVYIEAPVEQVYAFWSRVENFPLFLSNVSEVVDLGGGRSSWRALRRRGRPMQWYATVTDRVPNESIGWRSEPGAVLENAGVVRCRRRGEGTQLDLRLCYRPLGGAGLTGTDLLGADPLMTLNQDLDRLKALLEATIRSESYGQESES